MRALRCRCARVPASAMCPQWSLALPALAVSGATDWADGWAARRFNQPSVIGSYLDPLADKARACLLLCCSHCRDVLLPAGVATTRWLPVEARSACRASVQAGGAGSTPAPGLPSQLNCDLLHLLAANRCSSAAWWAPWDGR